MIQMETVQKMFHQIMGRFDNVDRTLERMNKVKGCLDGTRCWRIMTCAVCSV